MRPKLGREEQAGPYTRWYMVLLREKKGLEFMAAKGSNMDRQLEAAMEGMLLSSWRIIKSFIKGLFRGIRKLNNRKAWIGLLAAIAVAVGSALCKESLMGLPVPIFIRWLLYAVLIGLPFLYLYILGGGGKTEAQYDKVFKAIDFIGKDGKYPIFCGSRKSGKKEILCFKSMIPLAEWKAARDRLETALDCNILKMESGNSKKVVQLTVLPSDYKIPEMITWEDSICSEKSGTLTIGQSALEPITFDLNRVPHVLVAGETGSGKSVILRCILWQMILQGSKVFMIDFKGGVEFGKQYEQFGEVIVDRERALEVLDMLVKENEYRLRIFRDMEVKNLAEYNRKTKQNLCRIGVFSDELAEMLDKKGVSREQKAIYEALEGRLSTLARLSRATGINLFLGVQRPDANVLTGQIKNNIPVRISGRFADKTASEIVLGNTDAVDLPDIKGRFLYKVGNETIEFQSYYFDDEQMLHDVSVETGSMLTEPDNDDSKSRIAKSKPQERKPEATENHKPAESGTTPEKAQKAYKKKENKKKVTENTAEDDADAYPDWGMEEELPFSLDEPEELPFSLDEEPSDKDIFDNLDLNF